MRMNVYDYSTGEVLRGRPTKELREKSEASSSGVVAAYKDSFNWWQYVREDEVDYHLRILGMRVQTVFVR